MEEIRSISTTTVAPKNPMGSSTRMELTPWELRYLLIDPIQRGLLFRKQLPHDPYAIMDHLKNSLSRTLDLFYPLAGRLGTTVNYDDDTICFFINCNAAGVPFIHAVADGVTVRDILDPTYVPDEIVSSFFPLNGTQNYQGVSEPLLAVQATELEDGIFIGCTMNHVVADGTSFWHFFNSWAEISRGASDNINIISQSPVFDREFVPHYFPIRIPQSALAFCGLPSSPTHEIIFHFTKEKMAALKAKANEEKETNKISSLQALMSHIWLSIIRNRRLPEDQETTCAVPIGMRSRVHPPLSEHYFGAAVQGGTVTVRHSTSNTCIISPQ